MEPYIDEKDILSPLHSFPIALLKKWSSNLSNKTVIEVGCGNGLETFALARYFKLWQAIDPSKSMLNQARQLNQMQSNQNITFHENMAEALPFESDSADIVMFTRSFHFIKDKNVALSEAHRVLVDSGIMVIVESGRHFACEHIRIGSPSFDKKRFDRVISNRKPTNKYIASIDNSSSWNCLYESRDDYGIITIFKKI